VPYHTHFGKSEEKEFSRNRNAKTNVVAAKREWDIYQRRQAALSSKLARDSGKIEQLRTQLTKARKLSDNQKKRAADKEAALKKEKENNKMQKQQSFIDALVMTGTPPVQAEKMFMEYVKRWRMIRHLCLLISSGSYFTFWCFQFPLCFIIINKCFNAKKQLSSMFLRLGVFL